MSIDVRFLLFKNLLEAGFSEEEIKLQVGKSTWSHFLTSLPHLQKNLELELKATEERYVFFARELDQECFPNYLEDNSYLLSLEKHLNQLIEDNNKFRTMIECRRAILSYSGSTVTHSINLDHISYSAANYIMETKPADYSAEAIFQNYSRNYEINRIRFFEKTKKIIQPHEYSDFVSLTYSVDFDQSRSETCIFFIESYGYKCSLFVRQKDVVWVVHFSIQASDYPRKVDISITPVSSPTELFEFVNQHYDGSLTFKEISYSRYW
eukprot:TRINITY_DN15789_c0_g1_i1.p1 TRINITY_DN15789_c0_g1~~TRINITY_DN15789_c0_g1_i1.p1  ORF type:complete len:266 (+),score=16.19 TRINITY_DN15789_c0_g1_i1:91-888(+)